MATRLEDLTIDRVDLVDRGANPHAHVLLYKREQPKHVEVQEPGRVTKRLVEDRHDSRAFAAAFPSWVQVASNGDVYIGLGARATRKPDEIVKFAAQLPIDSKRYVYTPAALGGMLVAFPGQTVADAMRPVGDLHGQHVAKYHLERNDSMSSLPSVEIISKALAGERVALAKCRADFETLAKSDPGPLSNEESAELQLLDPLGRLSAPERNLHVWAMRHPQLCEAHAAAVGRGIA